jgi:hypothetical protein
MTPRRYLLPLSLALAVGAAPLLAQDAQPGTEQPTAAAGAPKGAPAPQSSAGKKDNGAGANTKPRADSGGDSPFDYRASEEISEDLPVSFPADI